LSISTHPQIRRLLHQYHDGLTPTEIAERLELRPDSVRRSLKDMPDTYIDRWILSGHREPPESVWCAVVPPEDCPKPKPRGTK